MAHQVVGLGGRDGCGAGSAGVGLSRLLGGQQRALLSVSRGRGGLPQFDTFVYLMFPSSKAPPH